MVSPVGSITLADAGKVEMSVLSESFASDHSGPGGFPLLIFFWRSFS
jgi:hypothetical protein